MTSFETQNYEVADGVNYEYYYVKAKDDYKPTLLFLHGFPSSFHCWRHQINYFSKQSYGCLAPNLMGYGKTYSPLDSDAFRTKSMVEHLISLLDHLKLDKVIVLGHDWGTRPACRFVLYHPERTLGLVLFNVGYRKPVQLDLQKVFQISRHVFGYELVGYWEFFTSDDAAKLIEENADRFIDIAYTTEPELWKTDLAPLGKAREWLSSGKTTTRASYMTDEDYEVVRKCLTKDMKSKLNWYTSAVNNVDWNDEKDLDPKLKRPVLYIAGTKDYICVPKQFVDQKEYIADLDIVEIETSHWTMEEKPDEVNHILEKWMQKFL